MSLLFAGGAQAATAVNLRSAANFSVLADTTITNTGATTLSDDLGLYPGTSVTGAPQTLGTSTSYIDDGVAQQAQTDLTAAISAAAAQPGTAVANGELGQATFTPGVYTAPTLDLAVNDPVTLDAQGNPNAVFIFRASTSTLTTGSNTQVLLINGAQACNVFWEVGSTATLGSNSTFVGTVMASGAITAGSGATIDGRLLTNTDALTLNTNTITTSACAAGTTGGPTVTTPPTPTTGTTGTTSTTPTTGTTGTTSTTPTTGTTGTTSTTPTTGTTGTSGSGSAAAKAAKAKAAKAKAAKAARAKAARIKAAKAKGARIKAAKVKARARRLARERARRVRSPARRPKGTPGFTG